MAEQVDRTPPLPTNTGSGPHSSFLGALVGSLLSYLARVALRANDAYQKDGTEGLTPYTVATLPVAADHEGAIIYVQDGAAGQKLRFSDGTSWLNVA